MLVLNMLFQIIFSNAFEITLIAFEVNIFMDKFYMFQYITLFIGTKITVRTFIFFKSMTNSHMLFDVSLCTEVWFATNALESHFLLNKIRKMYFLKLIFSIILDIFTETISHYLTYTVQTLLLLYTYHMTTIEQLCYSRCPHTKYPPINKNQ